MKPSQLAIIAVIGASLGAGVGVGWQKYKQSQPTLNLASPEQIDSIPDYRYPDLDGVFHTNNEWLGKIVVLNFWATWCPPCREEMPLFVELQEQYANDGVQFIAIAIDDLEPTKAFADTYGIDFPILMGDIEAINISKKLGNRFEGLPFTVVARPDGSIAMRHAGGVTKQQLEQVFKSILNQK